MQSPTRWRSGWTRETRRNTLNQQNIVVIIREIRLGLFKMSTPPTSVSVFKQSNNRRLEGYIILFNSCCQVPLLAWVSSSRRELQISNNPKCTNKSPALDPRYWLKAWAGYRHCLLLTWKFAVIGNLYNLFVVCLFGNPDCWVCNLVERTWNNQVELSNRPLSWLHPPSRYRPLLRRVQTHAGLRFAVLLLRNVVLSLHWST